MKIFSVKIVGSGLIGTSIGLALAHKNVSVLMADSREESRALSQALVDPGRIFEKNHHFDLIILAVPPSSFKSVLDVEVALNPTSTFVDIMSIKTKPQQEVDAFSGLSQRYVGTHPMAGREVAGAQSARGDLFVGRPWIMSASSESSQDSQDIAKEMIELCGGVVVHMPADEHDQAMALVSHAPQVLASVVAGQLLAGKPQWLPLIGQGFKDLTRIADSDSALWKEILSENSANVRTVIKDIRAELENLETSMADSHVAEKVIEKGNSGRKLIPGKHGSSSRTYIYLHVVIDDKAGQLAAIFNDCASAEVNIEDVSIEHTPGQNTGLVTLSILDAAKAKHLKDFLISSGWKVHSSSK